MLFLSFLLCSTRGKLSYEASLLLRNNMDFNRVSVIQYLVEVVPHVEHFLSRQGRDNLSQTLQRLLLAVENSQMEPTERRREKK